MIKLIASDLDGTLLDEQKNLPEGIFPLIERLKEQDIIFVPASGRQAYSLEQLFAPIKEDALFLCENGALVKRRGQTLYCNPIPDGDLKHVLDEIRAIPHLYPVLCGTDWAYIEDKINPFHDLTHRFYPACKDVNRLEDVIGVEPVCKISVYDDLGVANNAIKTLPQRLPTLRAIQSGEVWCDVSSPTANKGTAIKFIQQYLHITGEECVAFGDHMNDYEMLAECGHPFVPENAFEKLKEQFCNVIPSNQEGGVLVKIEQILRGEL